MPQDNDSSPPKFKSYVKEEICGTMQIVPEGTYDPSEGVRAETEDEIEAVERAVLNYYVRNNDMIDNDDDDDTDTDYEM